MERGIGALLYSDHSLTNIVAKVVTKRRCRTLRPLTVEADRTVEEPSRSDRGSQFGMFSAELFLPRTSGALPHLGPDPLSAPDLYRTEESPEISAMARLRVLVSFRRLKESEHRSKLSAISNGSIFPPEAQRGSTGFLYLHEFNRRSGIIPGKEQGTNSRGNRGSQRPTQRSDGFLSVVRKLNSFTVCLHQMPVDRDSGTGKQRSFLWLSFSDRPILSFSFFFLISSVFSPPSFLSISVGTRWHIPRLNKD